MTWSATTRILKKKAYYQKTLTPNAVYSMYLRSLDITPIFSEWAWLQIPVFDLTELGMGLLYSILPMEFEPVTIDFTWEMPSLEEISQGIWANFEPVDFTAMYIWFTDFREYVIANFKEQFQTELLLGIMPKAIYGVTPYGRGVYDPIVAREFLRATFWKLRLLRSPDISWIKEMELIAEYIRMLGVTSEHIFNRLMMILSAQTNAFVLGLSVLGRSRLTETEDGWGIVPVLTYAGEFRYLYFKTLDHLQMGFVLGMTPLGYGLLLPEESIYKLPDGKKNPPVVQMVMKKVRGIVNRTTGFVWAYTNYCKPEEMTDYHRNQRVAQYDILQTQREFVENWTAQRIPKEEQNPIRVRQYQNAMLQLMSWRAKRHSWGFNAWKAMSDEEFKGWWIRHWSEQGLNTETLEKLYEEAVVWLKTLQREKLEVGKKLKEIRRRLAKLL
jgi:hypothetical protein